MNALVGKFQIKPTIQELKIKKKIAFINSKWNVLLKYWITKLY